MKGPQKNSEVLAEIAAIRKAEEDALPADAFRGDRSSTVDSLRNAVDPLITKEFKEEIKDLLKTVNDDKTSIDQIDREFEALREKVREDLDPEEPSGRRRKKFLDSLNLWRSELKDDEN